MSDLLARKEDGRVKLYATLRALQARRDHAPLFSIGEYIAAATSGELRMSR